jgi:hypothetical protein
MIYLVNGKGLLLLKLDPKKNKQARECVFIGYHLPFAKVEIDNPS